MIENDPLHSVCSGNTFGNFTFVYQCHVIKTGFRFLFSPIDLIKIRALGLHGFSDQYFERHRTSESTAKNNLKSNQLISGLECFTPVQLSKSHRSFHRN